MAKVEWKDIFMVIADINVKEFFKLPLCSHKFPLFLGLFNLLSHTLQTLFSLFL